MKKFLYILLLIPMVALSATPQKTYVTGEVYDITSVTEGLLIRVDGNVVPTDCVGLNPHGWMLIKEENKTMISVALAMRAQGKRNATLYINGIQGAACVVSQYDPHG
ncbi:ABC transporter ATP-binding protein [Vibrio coralliilyticus]|uniref:ABC transporter ATP-binding protein n=1 Tax=Vibrio coralliilyticus TaxID=190893 RepID=UPI00155FAA2A|nr:ABC transporter ATP-binding protein [Vibrio coralliilyticus]NRF28260.1 ABC transporter ATP-binding protein [Vibrio coralliilyticus]NRF51929.1 ABC transporter ATP-binding protein [Vibrio coralliilyticus]NRG05560.1 ABC transporter ATP-binding protein [Vibrio coralliilyticus]